MDKIMLPYVRRAWYHIMAPNELLRERVIFDYELIYIKEGTAIITIDGEAYAVKPGNVIIFRPNQRHSIHVAEHNRLVQPHVHFDLLYRKNRTEIPISFKNYGRLTAEETRLFHPDILDSFCSPFPRILHPQNTKYIEILLFDLIEEFRNSKNSDTHDELKLVYLFLRLWEQIVAEARFTIDISSNQKKIETAEKIKIFIEHNTSRSLSVNELSEIALLSQGHVFRIFKESFGISPIKYHSILRVQKAKSMIQYTNLSITDISSQLGFTSVQDFCRTFKRLDGHQPNSYRYIANESQKA